MTIPNPNAAEQQAAEALAAARTDAANAAAQAAAAAGRHHRGGPAVTTTYTVPALDDDTADLVEDLTGIDPDLDTAVAALTRLATKPHDLDTVPTLLASLAGGTHGNPDLLRLIAQVIERIGDPSTNPALRNLTPHRAQQVRKHTRQYAHYDADFVPRGLCSEAAGYADPGCPLPTHH